MKTTREQAKETVHKDLVNNLQGLLKKNYDAEKGFTKAMEDAKDSNLKRFLGQQARQRNKFATELDNEIRSLNEKPTEDGSTTGDLHRTWIDIKTAFTGNDDEAVLVRTRRTDGQLTVCRVQHGALGDALSSIGGEQHVHLAAHTVRAGDTSDL